MKKIMFNTELGLEQAVLEGRKTQTRRIVPKEFFTLQWDVMDDTLVVENEFGEFVDIINTKYCMFKVGEIVAVAQSYKDVDSYYLAAYQRQHSIHGMTVDALDCVSNEDIKKWFKNRNYFKDKASWNNKMFVKSELMPHLIRITDVRIERLQDISDEDCLKEGIEEFYTHSTAGRKAYTFNGVNESYKTPREAYASLIDKVSGKGTWKNNPYVFVYDFELVK